LLFLLVITLLLIKHKGRLLLLVHHHTIRILSKVLRLTWEMDRHIWGITITNLSWLVILRLLVVRTHRERIITILLLIELLHIHLLPISIIETWFLNLWNLFLLLICINFILVLVNLINSLSFYWINKLVLLRWIWWRCLNVLGLLIGTEGFWSCNFRMLNCLKWLELLF
jgi:hypothetical protein